MAQPWASVSFGVISRQRSVARMQSMPKVEAAQQLTITGQRRQTEPKLRLNSSPSNHEATRPSPRASLCYIHLNQRSNDMRPHESPCAPPSRSLLLCRDRIRASVSQRAANISFSGRDHEHIFPSRSETRSFSMPTRRSNKSAFAVDNLPARA